MKNLLLIASFLMFSVSAFAQREIGAFTLQPKAGVNIANITELSDSDPRIGLACGAELEYQFTRMLSVSVGALYSMQGCKASKLVEGVNTKITSKVDYINIPILTSAYVFKGLALKFGIQPAIKVNSKQELKQNGKKVSSDTSGFDDDIKTFDFAIPIGLSYEYKSFVLDGRYNFGLSKIVDSEVYKNSVFQITLGYKFDL